MFAEVKIERIVPGGLGLAHHEGLTVFVALAAPGDVLRVRIDRTRGNIGFASIVEILQPSKARIEPPCPYFGKCGGCDFQQLNYQTQLDAKIEMIQDCLHRIAKIEDTPRISVKAAPHQWQYRMRANWQLDPLGRRIGYYEAGSHRVCDVEVCAVLAPRLQETLERIRHDIQEDAIEPIPKDIRAAQGMDAVSVAPPFADLNDGDISLVIGGETYWFNADSFFQANPDLLESLVSEAIGEARGMMALELYCGAGLFTLPLARRFERVIGVEVSDRAARFAERNLRNSGLSNATIAAADVAHWLSGHAVSLPKVDFLLLDPPRAGADNAVIKSILDIRPTHIAYVSCDPATLARDLKKLLAAGYMLDSVAAFDMFPQTHHVETVAHVRARAKSKEQRGKGKGVRERGKRKEENHR